MKLWILTFVLILLAAPVAEAQSASDRAWQQRLQVEIPLPVPLVELESINPFAVEIDEVPALTQSTVPRKVNVRGNATVAAFVDSRGECLGAVPLELPFPGLTSSIVQEFTGSRFDPASAGTAPQPSWVVLEVSMEGRVKEATIVDQSLEMPSLGAPPVPNKPPVMNPPGTLRNLQATPHAQLSSLAAPRRVKIKAPGRDDEIHLRALVHITENGRSDTFVPLEIYEGLNTWFSAFLASWRAKPASLDGVPVASWVVYSARFRMELSGLDSASIRVVRDREYTPTQ